MTLEFLKLADAALAKEFNKKPEKDVMPARRAKVIDSIDVARAQISKGEDNPKRGLYTTREGVSCATIRLGSKKLSVNGQEEFYVPKERLGDFYAQAKKAVEAGELDQSIKDALGIESKAAGKPKVKRGPRGEMAPELTHRRNVKRFGEARAAELLEANVKSRGWDKAKVLAAYKALPPL